MGRAFRQLVCGVLAGLSLLAVWGCTHSSDSRWGTADVTGGESPSVPVIPESVTMNSQSPVRTRAYPELPIIMGVAPRPVAEPAAKLMVEAVEPPPSADSWLMLSDVRVNLSAHVVRARLHNVSNQTFTLPEVWWQRLAGGVHFEGKQGTLGLRRFADSEWWSCPMNIHPVALGPGKSMELVYQWPSREVAWTDLRTSAIADSLEPGTYHCELEIEAALMGRDNKVFPWVGKSRLRGWAEWCGRFATSEAWTPLLHAARLNTEDSVGAGHPYQRRSTD